MGYPKRLLNADEEMVFDLRPHWKTLIVPAFLSILFVGGGTYAWTKWHNSLGRWVILGATLLLVLFFGVRPLIKWLTTHFVVTTRRVIMREGVIARQGRDIPLFRINDVTFSHTIVERMVGAGTLVVESAGEHGQVNLHDIPHVEQVQREIYKLVESDDARRRGVAPPGMADGGMQSQLPPD